MEFINHFRLSGVGIHLLIYCQIVTGRAVSALGAGRGRQAGHIPLVLQGAGLVVGHSPWQGKEPVLDGSSCVSLPHCRKGWSSTLLRQHVLHCCQICCFWHQSNTSMSHLSSYLFSFPGCSITIMEQQIFLLLF